MSIASVGGEHIGTQAHSCKQSSWAFRHTAADTKEQLRHSNSIVANFSKEKQFKREIKTKQNQSKTKSKQNKIRTIESNKPNLNLTTNIPDLHIRSKWIKIKISCSSLSGNAYSTAVQIERLLHTWHWHKRRYKVQTARKFWYLILMSFHRHLRFSIRMFPLSGGESYLAWHSRPFG